ncbi:MAG: hypothetical protein KA758_11900, partial [Acidimicrobiales bacterium]|nr:hypothetical protein [Acidimicrobiales bacterium]
AFVYAGVGVPVVSTPIANLGELDGLITVAEGVDGFVRAIEHQLAVGHQPVDRARLLPHTWGARLTRVLDLLDELGDRGAPVASRSAGPSGPSL